MCLVQMLVVVNWYFRILPPLTPHSQIPFTPPSDCWHPKNTPQNTPKKHQKNKQKNKQKYTQKYTHTHTHTHRRQWLHHAIASYYCTILHDKTLILTLPSISEIVTEHPFQHHISTTIVVLVVYILKAPHFVVI